MNKQQLQLAALMDMDLSVEQMKEIVKDQVTLFFLLLMDIKDDEKILQFLAEVMYDRFMKLKAKNEIQEALKKEG